MRNPRPWMRGVVTLTAVFAVPSFAVAQAIDACKVLPSADLEAEFGQKVTVPGTDASGTLGGGPMKGATQYSCAWWLGGPVLSDKATYVVVNVLSRAPQNEEETRSLSHYRASEAEWKKKGVPIEVTPIPGGDCRLYQRPESAVTSCVGGAKGRGLVLDVAWPRGVPARSLKPLVDQALRRL
ncbi:MAG: hypothetical protein ACXWK4_06445 [Myxococcaceae bacterium]